MTLNEINEYYLGQEIDDKVVTEDILNKAINIYCGNKRGKEFPSTVSNEYIVEMSLSNVEDFEKSIRSAFNLNPRQADTSVKFEDIRDMDLSTDELVGFKESEKKSIRKSLQDLSSDFELSTSIDNFWAWRASIHKLQIIQLETLKAFNRKEADKICAQEQIGELDKQLKMCCDNLNILKKQRDVAKEKPKTDESIAKAVNEMAKPIEQLQREAAELKAKKEEFLVKRGKNK